MKKILQYIMIFLPVTAITQEWYPIGATWYYNYQEELLFPAHGYIKYTVVKDTIIDGKLSKLISKETVRYNGNILSSDSLIAREENSKVYYYQNNTFKLMYDFTLNVGDTLDININGYACDSVSALQVDSIKMNKINGQDLRIQYLTGKYYFKEEYGGRSETITFPVIEKIGNDNLCFSNTVTFYFNPICKISDEFVWNGLRCYNDSNILYTGCYWSSLFPNVSCDTLIKGYVGINNILDNKDKFDIIPNPVKDVSNIHWNNSKETVFSELIITDIFGRVVKYINVRGKNNAAIKRAEFRPGLYFARFISSDNKYYILKIVIQ